MKVSLQWINEILGSPLHADDVVKALATVGFEVENTENKSQSINGVVIGEVRSVKPHPSADRLTVCSVFDGHALQTVVCGAPNVAEGIKVPFATVGATLPGNITIKKAVIRGVESSGMICSEKELTLSDDAKGIMHLPSTYTAGDNFCSAFGLDDTVIEYEVTPNRPDALSHIGIAREIGAALNISFFPPKSKTRFISSSDCTVVIAEPDACRRYCAQVIEDVKIRPSPQFVARRLSACGIRPINNIVDATNYILLETGHPLHAFDYDLLLNHEINVRWGRHESMMALDGKTYSLTDQTLVIADRDRPVAIAGIIGGEDTSVSEKTKNILIEAAHFDPRVIRRTARRLDIATESSYRFERGIDLLGVEYASCRAVDLMLMTAGGEKTISKEAFPRHFQPVLIDLRPDRVNKILGTTISKNTIVDILNRLNMEFINKGIAESLRFKVPSYRVDITEEIDLVEEIARHAGYQEIPTAPVSGVIMDEVLPETWSFQEELRTILNSAGVHEAYNYGFMSLDELEKLCFDENDIRKKAVSILNPLSQESTMLRTTLLPGLIRNAVTNISRKNAFTRLYEIGTVFFKNNGSSAESKKIAGIFCGKGLQNLWEGKPQPIDFRTISGIIEFLCARLHIADWHMVPEAVSYLHPGQSAVIRINDKDVGEMGRLHPDIHEHFKLEEDTYFFECDAGALMQSARTVVPYKQVPKYPSIKRDFSFFFENNILWSQIYSETSKFGGKLVEQIVPFDLYKGLQVKKNVYSLSFSVSLRSPERTLTDKEADDTQNKIINGLTRTLNAELRT